MKTKILFISLLLISSLACSNSVKSDDSENNSNKKTETRPYAQSGWDIYTAGTYRYGPSIIINDDGSIDAWFAAPGSTFGNFAYCYDSNNTSSQAIQLDSPKTAAQYFKATYNFYSVGVCCPSWNTTTASLRLSVYKWDTNYATTIKSAPINTKVFSNYKDNDWLSLTYSDDTAQDKTIKFPAGEYLWVLDQGANNQSGVWKMEGNGDINAVSYYNNEQTAGNYKSRILKDYSTAGYYWDQISYQHSTDGGKTWTKEIMTLQPTEDSRDAFSCCDPGVAKWGGYYYLGYTSTENTNGVDNHVYICRSTSPSGPWEKWNGSGWGGKPQPVIKYTGDPSKFGAGEPSIVIVDNTVYLYYSWNDGGTATRLSTASASDANWPAALTSKGTVIDKSAISGSDHCDIKYRDDIKKFYAIHTASRMSPSSYIVLWESSDGIKFSKVGTMKGIFSTSLHNCGWSGDSMGHINVAKQQYVSYAYGTSWGQWNTRWSPIVFK